MLNSTTKKSLIIIKEILLGNEISDFKNRDLKDIYKYETTVSDEIDEILDMFDMDIFEGHAGQMFIIPRIDNNIFGYKNKELKDVLNLDTNLDLYMCYFIMYCLISMFYKDATGRMLREYVSWQELLKEVTNKINLLKESTEEAKMDFSEIENKEGILAIINLWEQKLKDKINSNESETEKDFKSRSKVGYINRVLKFFQNQDLMSCDPYTYKYRPTDRFKTVVLYAYDNSTYNYIEKLNKILDNN